MLLINALLHMYTDILLRLVQTCHAVVNMGSHALNPISARVSACCKRVMPWRTWVHTPVSASVNFKCALVHVANGHALANVYLHACTPVQAHSSLFTRSQHASQRHHTGQHAWVRVRCELRRVKRVVASTQQVSCLERAFYGLNLG